MKLAHRGVASPEGKALIAVAAPRTAEWSFGSSGVSTGGATLTTSRYGEE
ncbi:MAG: hypothetical protein OEM94_09620 [Acidimicrobiia bacterium]|nr:hypothetical protein [Acidimicrobiia bacterium]